MINKIFGFLSFIFGVLMIILFPSARNYMPSRFSNAGVIIGIFFVALGIYILKA